MSKPKPTASSPAVMPPAALPFEEALAQLERIIERIEGGEVGLEESLGEYERGVGLINHCRSKLDAARQQVEDLTRKLQLADEESPAGDEGQESGDGAEADGEDNGDE